MSDISDDDMGAVGAGHDDANVEDVVRGVRPGAGNGSNEEVGGGAGEPRAVGLTWRYFCVWVHLGVFSTRGGSARNAWVGQLLRSTTTWCAYR